MDRGDSEQVFGNMVDGLALMQLVPVVHRKDPRAAQRPPRVLRSGAPEVPVDSPGERLGEPLTVPSRADRGRRPDERRT